MDKGKEEEVSKSLERSNNSKKKKRMEEETSDDLQKEELIQMNDQVEQKAGKKRFKTTNYPQRLKLVAGSELSKEETLLLSGISSEEEQAEGNEDDEATDSEETDSEEIHSEETETDEEPSLISPAGSSMNKPKGMTTTKQIIRELKKKSKWKSNSLSDTCTSTFRPYPTDKFPDSDKDESKKSPPVDQGSSCKKNL